MVTTLIVVGLAVLGSGVKKPAQASLFSPRPAYPPVSAPLIVQAVIQQDITVKVRPRDVAPQVYKQLPNLPLENRYINQETGKVDSGNTLLNRLIRYHIYVKGRPPIYRLDWKLTLADYLGANEFMEESRYPGSDSLRGKPIEGDRAAISRLNRNQRDALVQVLVSIFNPNSSSSTLTPSAGTQLPGRPKPNARPIPSQPQPEGAHLLTP